MPIEAATGPEQGVPAFQLRVRYMGYDSVRRDWYIASQRPTTAYPLWAPGRGVLANTTPDQDYLILVRDDQGGFHARWLRAADLPELPQELQGVMRTDDVGVAGLTPALFDALDARWHFSLSRPEERDLALGSASLDELIVIADAVRAHGATVAGEARDDLVDDVARVATASGRPDGTPQVDLDAAMTAFAQARAGNTSADPAARRALAVLATFAGDDERLQRTAEAIRSHADTIEPRALAEELDGGLQEAEEGRILSYVHLRRERSRALRDAKVASVGGRPICEACRFDFEAVYGDRGRGFIECHHRVPLHELDAETATRLDDLALVCANCHRMIHATARWLTVEELQALIGKQSG